MHAMLPQPFLLEGAGGQRLRHLLPGVAMQETRADIIDRLRREREQFRQDDKVLCHVRERLLPHKELLTHLGYFAHGDSQASS